MKKTSLLVTFLLLLFANSTKGQQVAPSQVGYAPVNGIKVYYEVYGEGKPLILLHGAFYTISMNWAELLPELSKKRKVIALEMQSHGHSPYSDRKLDIKTLASDVAKVMEYLRIDSADVAGYSMGGSIAYQFAVDFPNRLRRLVILSSTYKSSGWLPEVNNAFTDFKPELFDGSPLQIGYDAVAPDKSKWHKFLKQMFDFSQEPFDVGDAKIAALKKPVLIISGDNDGVDKIELAKTYQLLGGGISADLRPMPASQLAILPSQAHVSLMMQTSLLLEFITAFLK